MSTRLQLKIFRSAGVAKETEKIQIGEVSHTSLMCSIECIVSWGTLTVKKFNLMKRNGKNMNKF